MRSTRKTARSLSATILLTVLLVDVAGAQRSRCTFLLSDEIRGYTTLPTGDVFCALTADPKQPHSFISYVRGTSGAFDTDVGSIGIGEHFGLFRWGTLQLSIGAGIFAQFDLQSASYDLINADYLIGLPLTYRLKGFSSRLRLYHQSSHLGDELLLRDPPVAIERENLSYESLEVILSQEVGALRLYGGGEMLFNREPETLEAMLLHWGAELYPSTYFLRLGQLGRTRFVAAADVKAPAEQRWSPALSIRAGLEFGQAEPSYPSRRWSIVGEYYTGPSPYGQFFDEQATYFGVGAHLSL